MCKEPLLKVAGVTTKCYIPKKSTKTIQKKFFGQIVHGQTSVYSIYRSGRLVCILFTEVGGNIRRPRAFEVIYHG